MKGILAAIATAAILAAGATAGVEAVTPSQFAALSKRVAALEKKNVALEAERTYVDHCLGKFEAIAQSGGLKAGEGYVYDNGDGTQSDTGALHLTGEAQPQFWFVSAPSDCVGAMRIASYRGG